MQERRFERACVFTFVLVVGFLFPSEALVSGRNRTVPLGEILKRTQAFLLVDLAAHKKQTRTVSLPVPNKDPMKFEFEEQSIPVLDILYLSDKLKNGAVKMGSSVRYVSIAVQRAREYQLKVSIDGSRKRMWYDQNPAFDEARTGPRGLLLLRRFDEELQAYEASMGDGILPLSYLEQIRAHLAKTKKSDRVFPE